MSLTKEFKHSYEFDPKYSKSVAYFSMEFAIDQALKTYSGGLGFLAGSHMRSAYDLKQNVIGISILWKYGYYDQIRKGDQSMDVLFQEKIYRFLDDTNIKFSITINNHPVVVKAYFLKPETFGTVPIFFLSTDVPENDYLAQSTTHKLYDSDPAAKIAQTILLGVGGAKLLDELKADIEIYHLNEAHALSAAFYLYKKFKSSFLVGPTRVQKKVLLENNFSKKMSRSAQHKNYWKQNTFLQRSKVRCKSIRTTIRLTLLSCKKNRLL